MILLKIIRQRWSWRERIPLSRCKKCVRFRNSCCPLNDLDPCDFVEKPKKKK